MTTMNTCSLLLAAVAVATTVVCNFSPSPATAVPDPDPDPYPCPWRTVANPADPFIQNLGRWAVHQQHIAMRVDKVESAKLQGIGQLCTTMSRNYYYQLIIDASIDDEDYKYRAVVYVTNFTQPQRVISFRAIDIWPAPPSQPPAAN